MSKKLSKEEIAKQFQLPERKSKIATLLKQDDQVYCICRSSDSSQFMIACDNCEEWYHGKCVGITEKQSNYIKNYYCFACQDEDSSLRTRFKKEKPLEPLDSPYKVPYKQKEKYDNSETPPKKKKLGPGRKRSCDCANCRRGADCGFCNFCVNHISRRGYYRRPKGSCLNRICLKKNEASKKIYQDSSSDGETGHSYKEGMQCYGPECSEVARLNSKYCSDSCGMKLAEKRIYHILPQRIHQWALSPSVAEEFSRRQLENVRKGQDTARLSLKELDKRHLELDAIIERAKRVLVDPEAEDDFEDECEASMYCITCGHEIHSRSAIKHLEKCFNKYESQSSFGSIYKTRIDGYNMFCDFYNSLTKTYCKRLRILCPEHYKEPKVLHTQVCGCPLVTNVFSLTGDFCRASKKACVRHYNWDKLRRAEIDMERVRQWLKLDELIESERQIRQRMACRAGVLPLLLHSTYDHRIERMNAASKADTKKTKPSGHVKK